MLKSPTKVVVTQDGGERKSKGRRLKIPAIKDEEAIEIGSQLMIEVRFIRFQSIGFCLAVS